MGSPDKIRDRIYCQSCGRSVAITSTDFLRYENAERLVQRDGTGRYVESGSRWIPAEFITNECDECRLTPRERPSVELQLANIRAHQLAIEAEGVGRDEAIKYAVERQLTMSEIKLSPTFVARVHGLALNGEPRRLEGHGEPISDYESEAVAAIKARRLALIDAAWAAPLNLVQPYKDRNHS